MKSKELEVVEASALEAITRSEIDVQIRTAKQYPRDLVSCQEEAAEMATINREVAEECQYAVPRGGKVITGPSVRFSEIVQHCWGNMRVVSRVMDIGQRFVKCMAVALDLETNSAQCAEVTRRITGRDGKRYNDDGIQNAANAGCSIARRNAVLAVVPKPFWWPSYQAALRFMRDGKEPLAERRNKAVAFFSNYGVSQDMICKTIGVKRIADIDSKQMETLHGFATAIKDGMDAEEIFGDHGSTPAVVQEAAKKERKKKAKPEPTPEPGPVDKGTIVIPECATASVGVGGPAPSDLLGDLDSIALWNELKNLIENATKIEKDRVKSRTGVKEIPADGSLKPAVLSMLVEELRKEIDARPGM